MRLSDGAVRAIHRSNAPAKVLAEDYGITVDYVNKIKRGVARRSIGLGATKKARQRKLRDEMAALRPTMKYRYDLPIDHPDNMLYRRVHGEPTIPD
jgi:hypothetical protein